VSTSKISYPDTANPTWSGFIYQGHVALYHSICCLIDGLEFNLQLDSIEDFSLIIDGIAQSTHQVKALAKYKKSDYTEALEKASATHIGCDASTIRYFHVSSKLDDTSDFVGHSGKKVKFYLYEKNGITKPFCYLQDIVIMVKDKINEYLILNGLVTTDFLLNFKFDLLHSKIASQVVFIHAYNQDGLLSAAEAAYTQTFCSKEFQALLSEEAAHPEDDAYQRVKAKSAFYEYFFDYLNSSSFNDVDYDIKIKVVKVLDSIKSLDDTEFNKLWKSLYFGSSESSIDNEKVYDYVDIIAEIKKQPILAGTPPYYKCLKNDKYLPTAITINKPMREIKFAEDLIHQLKKDANLIDILIEYEWLIAACANQFSPAERFCTAKGMKKDTLEDEFLKSKNNRRNIAKALSAKIISIQEAGDLIND
jgi:hypothetical protein